MKKRLIDIINSNKFFIMWKKRMYRKRRWYGRLHKRSISSNKVKLYAKIARYSFSGILIILLGSFIFIPVLSFGLPSPDKIIRHEGFSTKIYDRNGELLYDIYSDQNRTPVEIGQIPNYLKEATLAIEDKNFYKHQGFDPLGMVRGVSRIFTLGYAQGGSTLTQQLVKNVLLTSERSLWRKFREFVLAIQIERKYSKDEILQMYLNEAPYGGTSWGVGAASENYFGKPVSDLNLVESAILAGLPQRPSKYSPYSGDGKGYLSRTRDVLRRMREDGYITTELEENALENLESVVFIGKGAYFKAPHFVQYVEGLLEERYGQKIVEQGGLKVTTTLDLTLQEEAQKIVTEEIKKTEKYDITNGAAVIIDPETSEILAMVGSKDFNASDYDGQVNVTLSLRQPGSAFKPFTYVTALKENYTASTLIMDVPTEFPGGVNQPPYNPVNYDEKFRGPLQMRYALGNSINIPAVKMLAMVGIKNVLQTAYDLGISSLEPTNDTLNRVGLSLTLGGGEVRLLELTGAYGAFFNKGYKLDPLSILKVEDSRGKVLENNKPEKSGRVLTEEEAFLISDILSDNEARKDIFGSNSLLHFSDRKIAVKTGTTNDKRDNWTIGGNGQVVVGVWVGNNDNSPMKQVASGISGASPIWRSILIKALEGKPNIGFEVPSGVVSAAVDNISGYAAHDGYPSRMEYFIKGTEPGYDRVHLKLKVCKSDGKLATPSDVSSGNFEDREFYLFKEEDPTAGPGGVNKWQEGILAWLSTQGDSRYHPPSDYCGTSNPINIEFVTPSDHDSNLPGRFAVEIKAQSTSEIKELILYVNGERLRSFTSLPYRQDIELSNGLYEIKATVRDGNDKQSEKSIKIGVGMAWDYTSPTPTPLTSPTGEPTYIPTL